MTGLVNSFCIKIADHRFPDELKTMPKIFLLNNHTGFYLIFYRPEMDAVLFQEILHNLIIIPRMVMAQAQVLETEISALDGCVVMDENFVADAAAVDEECSSCPFGC